MENNENNQKNNNVVNRNNAINNVFRNVIKKYYVCICHIAGIAQ